MLALVHGRDRRPPPSVLRRAGDSSPGESDVISLQWPRWKQLVSPAPQNRSFILQHGAARGRAFPGILRHVTRGMRTNGVQSRR